MKLILNADCILEDSKQSMTSGVVIHEFFHAIGFHHELQRIDYVDYIHHHKKSTNNNLLLE